MTTLTLGGIIRQIADLQDKSGLFPSVRHNPAIGYRRLDTNVFFTASTVFALQPLRGLVSSDARLLIDRITERANNAYPLFRNKDGLATYNFWPTRPSRHFPNGYLFRHFEHFRIPDDIDDTALVYLTSNPTQQDGLWLNAKLAQHANGRQPHHIQNTYADYRHLRAYSTWFGKNMPVDFDACALSNVLYCLHQFNLPRTEYALDSLTYLRLVVESGRYVAEPFRCAPHYARTSLIIYHLARLMAAFDLPELEPVRPHLISDAQALFMKATNRMEQVLLATSLLRLGQPAPAIELTSIEENFADFHFFIAGLLTAYEHPWLRRFADQPLVQMRWQCNAHCWALVAEYMGQSISGALV